MANHAPGQFGKKPNSLPVPVTADVSTTDSLKAGMPVCFKSTSSTVAERYSSVVKPSLANINDFAGIIAEGSDRVGPGDTNIEPWDGTILRGARVWTDENITAGDLLGPIPGKYLFGKCVVGRPVFRATESVDRSTTPGLVTGDFGLTFSDVVADKIVRFFDHFLGERTSAAADADTYVLTGTGATLTFADALGPDEAAANKRGAGVGVLSGLTTGFEANLQLNGEPFNIATGKSIFFRARIAANTVGATVWYFVGLNLGATTDMGDASGTDFIGFRIVNTALDFVAGKNATGSALNVLTNASAFAIATPVIAADVFHDVAFLVRNKAAAATPAAKELTLWVNGVEVAITFGAAQAANICDDESLTFAAVADGGAANAILRIDSVEINNYF
jgi:hypothetical protein